MRQRSTLTRVPWKSSTLALGSLAFTACVAMPPPPTTVMHSDGVGDVTLQCDLIGTEGGGGFRPGCTFIPGGDKHARPIYLQDKVVPQGCTLVWPWVAHGAWDVGNVDRPATATCEAIPHHGRWVYGWKGSEQSTYRADE
jgi:hypothetical protein